MVKILIRPPRSLLGLGRGSSTDGYRGYGDTPCGTCVPNEQVTIDNLTPTDINLSPIIQVVAQGAVSQSGAGVTPTGGTPGQPPSLVDQAIAVATSPEGIAVQSAISQQAQKNPTTFVAGAIGYMAYGLVGGLVAAVVAHYVTKPKADLVVTPGGEVAISTDAKTANAAAQAVAVMQSAQAPLAGMRGITTWSTNF